MKLFHFLMSVNFKCDFCILKFFQTTKKNNLIVLWYFRLNYPFVFGKNWKHQKSITESTNLYRCFNWHNKLTKKLSLTTRNGCPKKLAFTRFLLLYVHLIFENYWQGVLQLNFIFLLHAKIFGQKDMAYLRVLSSWAGNLL